MDFGHLEDAFKKQDIYEADSASVCWQEASNLLSALDRDILIQQSVL
jgi:hypothetical protein